MPWSQIASVTFTAAEGLVYKTMAFTVGAADKAWAVDLVAPFPPRTPRLRAGFMYTWGLVQGVMLIGPSEELIFNTVVPQGYYFVIDHRYLAAGDGLFAAAQSRGVMVAPDRGAAPCTFRLMRLT